MREISETIVDALKASVLDVRDFIWFEVRNRASGDPVYDGYWSDDHDISASVIDPDTGQPVKPGDRGEMVLTTLQKSARPMIRFRTGDIVSFNPEPCRCGRTAIRLNGVHGRLDDMLIVKGVNLFPSDVEAVVRRFAEFNGEYRLVLGPAVYDAAGNAMDQNGNGIVGEAADAYTGSFTLDRQPLKVVSQNPASTFVGSLDHIDLTFSVPINPATAAGGTSVAVDPTAAPATPLKVAANA